MWAILIHCLNDQNLISVSGLEPKSSLDFFKISAIPKLNLFYLKIFCFTIQMINLTDK